jgi:hypothetical protein
MAGFKMQLTGVKDVIGELSLAGLEVDIQKELDAFALNVVHDAQQLAPVDEGFLRRQIGFVKGNLEVEIVVNCDYAAYVEFGTRKFAAAYVSTLPNDWKTFAARFKGPGSGTFEQLVMRIVEWVRRKGIGRTYNVATRRRDKVGKQTAATTDYATAYQIAHYIMITGIRPHPFLYPAYEKNRILLLEKLRNLLDA